MVFLPVMFREDYHHTFGCGSTGDGGHGCRGTVSLDQKFDRQASLSLEDQSAGMADLPTCRQLLRELICSKQVSGRICNLEFI
ncbi:hypothetical protein [Bradyrhizobium sp.]|uniref:hypothetical protein n=1 Tax=Bradyrhizobium sp. TaxID=376 RepID=UPI004037A5A1